MTKYAIVGDGAAGTTAAFYIRRSDPSGEISILSDESSPAYYRAALTNYLMGELRAEQLFAVPPDFYERSRVERVLARITGIDTANRRLSLSDGRSHPYDRLLIASGARARPPTFPGSDAPGVMTMRTMQDARFIMDQVQSRRLKRAVIVGGGILGLELVAGLRARGIEVTYVIRGDRFMPTILDRVASDLVVSRCRHFGVDVRMDEEVAEVDAPSGSFGGVRLKNSKDVVKGQLMIVAIGITPNIDFLAGSGINVNRGIPVDERMRTNVEDVFAGGDVAEVHDPWLGAARYLGLWEPARHHGRVAGLNMAGANEVWRLGVPYNATRLYDLDLGGLGQTLEQPGDEVRVDFPETGRALAYKKLVFRDDRLVGALLVGQRKERVRERASKLRQLIAARIDVSSVRDVLLDPLFDLNGWMDSLRSDARPSARGSARADMSRIMGRPGASASPVGASTSRTSTPPGRRVSADGPRNLSTLMRSVARAGAAPVTAPADPPPPRGPRTAMPTLKLHDGTLRAVDAPLLSLGRDPDNDVRVEDPRVSARHAQLRTSDAGVAIEDLASRNGTFVNDRMLRAPRTLVHGDVIRIGAGEMIFFSQVAAPRPDTGPAGLPDEPLERPVQIGETVGRITWDGQTVDITGAAAKIGRHPQDTQITLSDPAVSWLHAEITLHDGSLYLRDLGSRNGTFVNGELIAIPTALVPGDVIKVGNTDLSFASLEEDTRPFSAAAPAAPGEPGLTGTASPILGIAFALDAETTIGREQGAIVLRDPTVSRRHARIDRTEKGWTLRDLESTNGTFVNGQRLAPGEDVRLDEGDVIAFGRAEMRFGPLPADAQRAAPRGAEPAGPDEAAPQDATRVLSAADLLGGPGAPGPPKTIPVRLKVVRGPRSGDSIPLGDLPLVLGRQAEGEVVGLDDPYVSGRHLELSLDDDRLVARDLDSSNGTWIDDVQVEPGSAHPISAGTKLRLGPVSVLQAEG